MESILSRCILISSVGSWNQESIINVMNEIQKTRMQSILWFAVKNSKVRLYHGTSEASFYFTLVFTFELSSCSKKRCTQCCFFGSYNLLTQIIIHSLTLHSYISLARICAKTWNGYPSACTSGPLMKNCRASWCPLLISFCPCTIKLSTLAIINEYYMRS